MNFGTGLFNVEWRVCKNGKAYLMEVSPRAGGNRLAEILNYATDVDIIEAEVCKAIGDPFPMVHEPNYNGSYAIWVIHSLQAGAFQTLEVDEDIKTNIIETEIRIGKGQQIKAFSGANDAIGTLFLRANSRKEMNVVLSRLKEKVRIVVL